MAVDREAALKRAEKLLRQGKLDGAIEEYVRLIDDQPRDWNAINALGDLYVRAGDVDRAIAQFTPARGGNLASLRCGPQRRTNPLAHLGCCLAREGDRQDVCRIHAGAKQVDVAIDEHARLAGPGRRLESHVISRVYCPYASGAIPVRNPVFNGCLVFERQAVAIRHSPCGRLTNRRNSCRSEDREAWEGIRRP